MKNLIIYSTTYGYTKDCVEYLASKLKGETSVVNIAKDKEPDINEFDNIIIGGSVYVGKVNKRLVSFVSNNIDKITGKRVALFLSCGSIDVFEKLLISIFPKSIVDIAIAKECFGGELRTNKMKFSHRLITNMISKASEKEGKPPIEKLTNNIDLLAKKINDIAWQTDKKLLKSI